MTTFMYKYVIDLEHLELEETAPANFIGFYLYFEEKWSTSSKFCDNSVVVQVPGLKLGRGVPTNSRQALAL